MGSVSEQWKLRGFVVSRLRLRGADSVFRLQRAAVSEMSMCMVLVAVIDHSLGSSSCLQYVMEMQLSGLLDGLDHSHKHTIYLPSKGIIYLPIDGRKSQTPRAMPSHPNTRTHVIKNELRHVLFYISTDFSICTFQSTPSLTFSFPTAYPASSPGPNTPHRARPPPSTNDSST